jgi:hypothetical protein
MTTEAVVVDRLFKLVVFVPADAEGRLRAALGEAGAGRIGAYDSCCFVTGGVGYFRPLPGARPVRGEIGRVEAVVECRIETVVREELLPEVLAAMRQVHPYEEIAFDLVPLANHQYSHLVPPTERR